MRGRIADIGAGAGFPGLVLAAALPDAQVDLIESVGRKCEFMRRAIEAGRDRQRRGGQRPLRGAGGRREAARPTTPSRRAPSAASRPSPSSPRRCCARAACWSPGRAGATPTRRPSWSGAAGRWRCAPSGSSTVGPYAGSRHRHLHVMRKSGPDPAGPAAPPGHGEEATAGKLGRSGTRLSRCSAVGSSTRSRTRRAASARRRPPSTWPPASRPPAPRRCSSTSTRSATRPSRSAATATCIPPPTTA